MLTEGLPLFQGEAHSLEELGVPEVVHSYDGGMTDCVL